MKKKELSPAAQAFLDEVYAKYGDPVGSRPKGDERKPMSYLLVTSYPEDVVCKRSCKTLSYLSQHGPVSTVALESYEFEHVRERLFGAGYDGPLRRPYVLCPCCITTQESE